MSPVQVYVRCLLALIIFNATAIQPGWGVCCGNYCHFNPLTPYVPLFPGKCCDCTYGDYCCSYGPCNIFCCNCGGECRKGKCGGRRRRSLDPNNNTTLGANDHVDSIIHSADVDGDGRMSLQEAEGYLKRAGAPHSHLELATGLLRLDLNNNQYLEVDEIDADYYL